MCNNGNRPGLTLEGRFLIHSVGIPMFQSLTCHWFVIRWTGSAYDDSIPVASLGDGAVNYEQRKEENFTRQELFEFHVCLIKY